MKLRFRKAAIHLQIMGLFFSGLSPLLALGDTSDRVVHVLSHATSPVRITAMRVGDESIEASKPFAAEVDWLSRLTWMVKNVSEEPISYIEIDFADRLRGGALLVVLVGPAQRPG
ncbi:MAG: hypothetical protein ACE5JX_08415 [Acidobacteriota bacterium]